MPFLYVQQHVLICGACFIMNIPSSSYELESTFSNEAFDLLLHLISLAIEPIGEVLDFIVSKSASGIR